MRKNRKRNKEALPLILPAFILYSAVVAYPLLNMLYTSFFEWNGVYTTPYVFAGLKNYTAFFQDESVHIALKNIVIIMLTSVVGIVPVGLFLASVIQKKFFGLRFVRVSYFLPVIINKVSVGLMFTFILYPMKGPFAQIVKLFGGNEKINVLGNMQLAIWAVAFVLIWCNVGLHMVLYSSAMVAIPDDLIESAKLDGASRRQIFFKITLPLIGNTIQISVVLILMNAFKIYDLVVALTGGGPGNSTEVLSTILFKNAFYYGKFGYANAIGVITVLISLLITVVINGVLRACRKDG